MSSNGTSEDTRKGVDLLKELLFDNEAQELAGLDRRLKSVEEISAGAARERFETARRIEQLFERVGTEDRFRSSVAVVLDKALREAELRNHSEMSHAIAPLVIKTIKTELKNSQDEMVDILYPLTGRMVQAYVKSAITDLTRQINERIDQNPLMLRMRSWTSGKSVAELAIAESQRLAVQEVLLIRRGSGELVARWPESDRLSNADMHRSGVLAAINEFASTAFELEGGHFRSFEFENVRVFLRASPAYILAARCEGVAPSGIEQIFDEEFLATLERIAAVERAADVDGPSESQVGGRDLEPLADAVATRTNAIYEDNADSGAGGAILKLVLFLVSVPLLAWFFWGMYTNAEERLARRSAHAIVEDVGALTGYPVSLDIGYRGRSITLSGLAPDDATRRSVVEAMRQELSGSEVVDKLTVIPVANVDTDPVEQRLVRHIADLERDLTASAALRAVTIGEMRLREAVTGLERLSVNAGPALDSERIEQTREAVTKVLADVATFRNRLFEPVEDLKALDRFIAPFNLTSQRIATAFRGLAERDAASPPSADAIAPDTISGAADHLSSEAERLVTLVAALDKAGRMIPEPAPPPPPPPPQRIIEAPEVSPEDRLRRFVSRHAVFFSSGTEFAQPLLTAQTLEEAAKLIKSAETTLVRVVGYTDSQGGARQNSPLALSRATAVVEALAALGVPRERLLAVGRINGYFDISPEVGQASVNRRVEFEVGFIGEGRQTP